MAASLCTCMESAIIILYIYSICDYSYLTTTVDVLRIGSCKVAVGGAVVQCRNIF